MRKREITERVELIYENDRKDFNYEILHETEIDSLGRRDL